MSNKNRSAFPYKAATEVKGLTKREYLAAMALQGYCAAHGVGDESCHAEKAVKQADALINELEKTND